MKHRNSASAILLTMAYCREDFKKYVMEKMRGALLHFYMIHIARRNQLVKWTKHWETEIERLMIELSDEVASPIKGHWDRRKAAQEVISEMRGVDDFMRKRAASRIKAHYKLRRIRTELPPELTDEFYRRVEDEIENALVLPEEENP